MSSQTPRYLVGIDLGTTHTAVAYASADNPKAEIKLFEIKQLSAPGQVTELPLLPSVRYHPAENEVSEADLAYSPSGENAIIGAAARVLGAKTQGRLITSAKSWLSHPSVDHDAAILPWGSEHEVAKISPIDASTSYLAHVRTVWSHRFPDAPLEQQELVITVPASFDEAARSLTLEAAKRAGLTQVRLLEEPQAVFYDWLHRHQDQLEQALSDVHLLLILDVGGGTTDLTLIQVQHQSGQPPKLSRIGVGDHLMLGGDNIDLALAHMAESRINKKQRLSAAELSQLIEQCRMAKEILLAEDAPESHKVTLLGGGSKLIGGARSAELTKEEVRAIALEGFFPLSSIDDLPDKKRSGVVEFGLPYTAEPAVSKHIAAFLKTYKHTAQHAFKQSNGIPDALLLNGGVFRSKALTQRAIELLNSWSEKKPKNLENSHPELAVAFGAVSYAQARRGTHIKIGGGSARSYFLVIDTDTKNQQHGVCILPKGSEEGEEIVLKQRQFSLRLGQPVRFHLASLTGDSDFKAGDLTEIIEDKFHSLPPLAVAFKQNHDKQLSEVTVNLAVMLTEVGTLKIQCVAIDNPEQRWDVEFQIRKNTAATASDSNEIPASFVQAAEKINLIYGSKSKNVDPKAVKSLRADLEKLLGPRFQWQTPLLRELFAVLLDNGKNRRRSANHERIWLSLTGFCLRPGFGYPLDDWRVEQLWKLYPQGVQFVSETQNWTEWWTLWRRIAGGLDQNAQVQLFKDISKFINPASARQGNISKQSKQRSYDDMVRLAATLERLSVDNKIQLGQWLLKRLQKASESKQSWWAVGRIGARIPFHGSSHNVIPPDQVTAWLKQTLLTDWKKTTQAGFAATLICRKSGDRNRDIDDHLRNEIIDKLKQSKAPSSWIAMVEQVKQLDEAEEKQIFGEALPPGLKLITE